jgi:hypothetical protein
MSAGEATREFYREQGRKQEQERIIKLLEAQNHISDCCFQPNCCSTKDDLIALIKGEK